MHQKPRASGGAQAEAVSAQKAVPGRVGHRPATECATEVKLGDTHHHPLVVDRDEPVGAVNDEILRAEVTMDESRARRAGVSPAQLASDRIAASASERRGCPRIRIARSEMASACQGAVSRRTVWTGCKRSRVQASEQRSRFGGSLGGRG